MHKVTVLLLGGLGRQFGRRHKLAVSSAAEAVRALCANFPSFERELVASGDRGVGYRVLAGREALSLDRLHEPSGRQNIVIAPMISGAGGGLGQIFMGIVIIAISWWNPMGWAAAGSFLSQATLYSVGTAMIMGGVAQMISPTPKAPDPSERPENKPSYGFNGAVNTTAQGHPVAVGYGRLIVGSAVISAGIDVDEVPA
jgi:predicted phage tail protein